MVKETLYGNGMVKSRGAAFVSPTILELEEYRDDFMGIFRRVDVLERSVENLLWVVRSIDRIGTCFCRLCRRDRIF